MFLTSLEKLIIMIQFFKPTKTLHTHSQRVGTARRTTDDVRIGVTSGKV